MQLFFLNCSRGRRDGELEESEKRHGNCTRDLSNVMFLRISYRLYRNKRIFHHLHVLVDAKTGMLIRDNY